MASDVDASKRPKPPKAHLGQPQNCAHRLAHFAGLFSLAQLFIIWGLAELVEYRDFQYLSHHWIQNDSYDKILLS